jgi:hypothetical protein
VEKGLTANGTGCEMIVARIEVNKSNAGNGDIVKMSFSLIVFTPMSYRRNVVVSFLNRWGRNSTVLSNR